MTHNSHRLREWLPLLPLLLLLAATYWLNQQVQPLPPKAARTSPGEPDFIISNISATSINERGTPRFVLAARTVTHNPADDSTLLEEPRLTSLYADRPPVQTSAKKGEISSNGEEIFLRGDVKLVRTGNATQSELSFTTDYLHVIPDRDLADTDRPVTLKDARNIVQAVGMRIDNEARVVKLLSQVRSQHETAKN